MSTYALSRDCEQLTVEDWFTRAEIPELSELYQGMLLIAPLPGGLHQLAKSELMYALSSFADDNGGIALPGPIGVVVAPDVGFEPDVLYLPPQRARLLTNCGVEAPPDLVVEIASPGSRQFDRLTKLPTYLEHGVREVWIVDPETRTVEVHESGLEAPRTARFGEPIPSLIVDVGSGFLERVPESLEK